ncbi:2TM domain-containing protein [Chryseobacterium soli]|uniref:2TM domain-containing protein n=1 Tax=Chryseobacterium soli TaxID=445961 RepID=UPI0029551154|nr:2TM domain-containing protein [Chryseobacterium soli]MDV7696678.1 2TM domain-containing protein [Chryseobacterium soli]
MKTIDENDMQYREAARKVKRIKNFYLFVFIYVAVNLFILYLNYRELDQNETIWHIEYFILPIIWGAVLLLYGMSVYFSGFMLGRKWEEKKIKELMDKEK